MNNLCLLLKVRIPNLKRKLNKQRTIFFLIFVSIKILTCKFRMWVIPKNWKAISLYSLLDISLDYVEVSVYFVWQSRVVKFVKVFETNSYLEAAKKVSWNISQEQKRKVVTQTNLESRSFTDNRQSNKNFCPKFWLQPYWCTRIEEGMGCFSQKIENIGKGVHDVVK